MGNLLANRSNRSEDRDKDSTIEEELDWRGDSWNSEYSLPTESNFSKNMAANKISKQNVKSIIVSESDHSSSLKNKIRCGFKSKKSQKPSPKSNAKGKSPTIPVKQKDQISPLSESPEIGICQITGSTLECVASRQQVKKHVSVVSSKTPNGSVAQPTHRKDKFRSLIPRGLRRNKPGTNVTTNEENHGAESRIPAFRVSSSFYPERKSSANTKEALVSKYSLSKMRDGLNDIKSSENVPQNDELHNNATGCEQTITRTTSAADKQIIPDKEPTSTKNNLSMNWCQEIKTDKIRDGVFRFTGEQKIIERPPTTKPLFNPKLVPKTNPEFKNNRPTTSPNRHILASQNNAGRGQKDSTNAEYRTNVTSPKKEKHNFQQGQKIKSPVTKKDVGAKEALIPISSDIKNNEATIQGANMSLAKPGKIKKDNQKPGDLYASPGKNQIRKTDIKNTKVSRKQSPSRHDGHMLGSNATSPNGCFEPETEHSPLHHVSKEQQTQIVREQKIEQYHNVTTSCISTNPNRTSTETCLNSKNKKTVVNESNTNGEYTSTKTRDVTESAGAIFHEFPEAANNHQPTDNLAKPDTKSLKHHDDKKLTNSNDKSKRKKRQTKGKKKKQKKGNRWMGPKEFSKLPEEASAFLERYLTEDKTLQGLEKYSRFMAFHWRPVKKVNAITAIVLMTTHSKKWKNVDELEVVQNRLFNFVGKVELKDETLVEYLNKYYQRKQRLTDEEIVERDEQKKRFEKELEDLANEAADMEEYCAEILDRSDVQHILDSFMHRVKAMHGADCQCGMTKINPRKTKTTEQPHMKDDSDNELWEWLEDMMKRGNRPEHMKEEDIPHLQPSGDSKKTSEETFAEKVLYGEGIEINIDDLSAEMIELIKCTFPNGDHLKDVPEKLPLSLLKQLANAFQSKDEDQIRAGLEAYINHISATHAKLKEQKNAENNRMDKKYEGGQGIQQNHSKLDQTTKAHAKESPHPYTAFEVAGHVDDYITRGTKGKKGRPVEIKKKEKTRNGKKKNKQNPTAQEININH